MEGKGGGIPINSGGEETFSSSASRWCVSIVYSWFELERVKQMKGVKLLFIISTILELGHIVVGIVRNKVYK